MALHRGVDGSEPVRRDAVDGTYEVRRTVRSNRLGTGTLACPECDAPVAPGEDPLTPADPLACPFCGRFGPVRDFLSLAPPARPARVAVRVVPRRR